MKSLVRILLIVLVVVGLLAVAGVVAVPLLVETDLVRTSVQDQLTKLTNQQVSLGSLKVSLAFPRLVHLKLEGISVKTQMGEELFSANRIIFSPSLSALFRRQLDIESILVEQFRTSVIRAADGTIRNPFVPIALPRHPAEGKPEAPSTEGHSQADEVATRVAESAVRLNWSLKRFKLTEGRVEWIDQCVLPGKEVVIPVTGLTVDLSQDEPSAAVSVKATGKLGAAGTRESELRLDGSLVASPDRTAVEAVSLSLSADLLDLQPFRVYVSDEAAEGGLLDPVLLSGRCAWQKGEAPTVNISLVAKQKAEAGAQVSVDGKVALPADPLGHAEIAFTATSDEMPLKLFRGLLPVWFPLEPSRGVLKGSVGGKWAGSGAWNAHGKLSLEDAEPRGPYAVIGKPIRVAVEADFAPVNLSIVNAEIIGTSKIASIKGQIHRPFEVAREFDLNGEVFVNPALAPALRIRFPEGLRIEPEIPVHGRMSGTRDKMSFDLSADLTSVAVAFSPFVDKPRGRKGTLAARGTWQAPVDASGGPKLDADVALNASGVSLRPVPQAPGFSGLVLSANSKLFEHGGKVQLKDATMKLKRTGQGPDMLAVTGSLAGVGSPNPSVKAAGNATIDAQFLHAVGVPTSGERTVKGQVPLSVKVDGSLSALNWTVNAPLTGLDVRVKNFFHKPAGMQAVAQASLQSSGREVALASGQLTVPGASISARGVLIDRQGNFGQISCETKRANLERLLALFPELKNIPISGPVDATLHLASVQGGLDRVASIHPAGVNFRPDKANWAFEQMTGTVSVKGDSVEISEISGRVAGVVQGPFSVKGSLSQIGSLATLKGALSLDVGKGRIKADSLLGIISQGRMLARALTNPQGNATSSDLRDFNYLKGDVNIASGSARSDNIRLKGADISLGAIGSVKLDVWLLDALVGVRTPIPEVEALGKVGPVRDLIDLGRDLLKAKGLDRELRRLGIKLPEGKDESSPGASAVKAPVTVIVRLRGPASTPQVTPVLEASLSKEIQTQLKSLME